MSIDPKDFEGGEHNSQYRIQKKQELLQDCLKQKDIYMKSYWAWKTFYVSEEDWSSGPIDTSECGSCKG